MLLRYFNYEGFEPLEENEELYKQIEKVSFMKTAVYIVVMIMILAAGSLLFQDKSVLGMFARGGYILFVLMVVPLGIKELAKIEGDKIEKIMARDVVIKEFSEGELIETKCRWMRIPIEKEKQTFYEIRSNNIPRVLRGCKHFKIEELNIFEFSSVRNSGCIRVVEYEEMVKLELDQHPIFNGYDLNEESEFLLVLPNEPFRKKEPFEIVSLKSEWLDSKYEWELENTPGFGLYKAELRQFSEEHQSNKCNGYS